MPDAERSIEDLIFSYAAFVDDGDLEGVAALLADAVIGVDGVAEGLRGREKIQGLLQSTIRMYEDGTPRTKHVTTNVRIEVDDQAGTATARSSRPWPGTDCRRSSPVATVTASNGTTVAGASPNAASPPI